MTASFLVPFAAHHLADHKLLDATILRLRLPLLLAATGFAALCAAAAPQLLRLLYHHSSTYEAAVLFACVAVLPAYYGIHVYGSVLTAAGRMRYFIAAVAAVVILNIAGNLLLIPRFGALGCCYAALASQYACALLLFVGVRRHLQLSLQPLTLVVSLLLGWIVFGAVRVWLGAGVGNVFWWAGAGIAACLIMFVILNPGRLLQKAR